MNKDDARIYLKFIGDPNPDQQEFPLGFYSSEQLLTDKIEDELLDITVMRINDDNGSMDWLYWIQN